MGRPQVVEGGRSEEPTDSRVSAVLDVLGGTSTLEAAARWQVDQALLGRWVRSFVEAGTAQVTNRPTEGAAHQRDRFLAAFAHEVRTPLTIAKGWVSMLAGGKLPEAQVAASVTRLHEALDRLTERTLDVELMAAASLGRITLAPAPITVAELCRSVKGVPGAVDGDIDVDIDVEVIGGQVEVTVDPALFPRVLRDLWDAAGSSPEPRARRIEVVEMAPWIEIRVIRDADPIEPSVLQALFEPFDLNDDGTGVTIGLYLARALTVAHGGTVGVDQDDDGAALWVRIPGRPSA